MEVDTLRCIICNKKSCYLDNGECPSCKLTLDKKYGDDIEGREFSRRYFRWLRRDREEKE